MPPDELFTPIKIFWDNNKWLMLVVVMLILAAYGSVLILGKNNPIEIEIEKAIEKETGLQIDLTP